MGREEKVVGTVIESGEKVAETTEESKRTANLRGRYGAIGISAVAAAVRFTDAKKTPAYAPVDERFA
jgi:hypothetical protein